MTTVTPLTRRSLHTELLERLRDMILNGDLADGEKVAERQLCLQFGVSRTPLREALKVLAAEGLVDILPNRGAVITQLAYKAAEEALPILAALEGLSGSLACQTMTDGDIQNVRKLHDQMRASYIEGDHRQYVLLNRDIHESILNGARNQLLSAHYSQVSRSLRRPSPASAHITAGWERAMAEHEEIIRYLEERNAADLAVALKNHVMSVFRRLKSVPRLSIRA
jgi:DNA-binding GntR family transcriptional regulator